jgi:tetratricopeptide (TPR) repeat protein
MPASSSSRTAAAFVIAIAFTATGEADSRRVDGLERLWNATSVRFVHTGSTGFTNQLAARLAEEFPEFRRSTTHIEDVRVFAKLRTHTVVRGVAVRDLLIDFAAESVAAREEARAYSRLGIGSPPQRAFRPFVTLQLPPRPSPEALIDILVEYLRESKDGAPDRDLAVTQFDDDELSEEDRERKSVVTEHFRAGHQAAERGEMALAVEEWTKHVARFPLHVVGRFNLGLAHMREGDYEAGIRQFEWAVALAPWHDLALENLARGYRLTGRLAEAHWAFSRLIELNPAHEEAKRELGRIKSELTRRARE